MKTIRQLQNEAKEAVQKARASGKPEDHKAAKDAGIALAEAVVAGCEPCPSCGNMPHGIVQPRPFDGVAFDIGCITCRHHRAALSPMRDDAVENWNEGAKLYGTNPVVVGADGELVSAPKGWRQP